ncbi:hypothetical protein ACIQCV_15750 [Dietzia maris]
MESAEGPGGFRVAFGVPAGALAADACGQLLRPRESAGAPGRGVKVHSGGGGPGGASPSAGPGGEPGVLELPEEVEGPVGRIPGWEPQDCGERACGGAGVAE